LIGELDPTVDAGLLVSIDTLRPLIGAAMFALPPAPPEYRPFLKIPGLLDAIEVKSTLGPSGRQELVLRGVDEDSTKELEQLALKGIELARKEVLKNLPPRDPEDLMGIATEKYLRRLLDKSGEWFRPVRTGSRLTLSVENRSLNGSATVGAVLAAGLVPAVDKAREAANRTRSINNMKQIMLAMLNEEAQKQRFPARANFDKQGKPLLSWRVHMLPYLEQQALYQKFKLDEPWDSEHNKQLIAQIPEVYQSVKRKDTKTNYLAVVGPGALFEGTNGTRMAEVKDGLSNTIALVEVDDDRAVEWTKPDDFVIDRERPMAGLGRVWPGLFMTGFADGSVRTFPTTLAPADLLGMFTRAGGEVTPR
jgi:hypothetical protein